MSSIVVTNFNVCNQAFNANVWVGPY